MQNVKLLIEYDGTRFCGWQRQENGRTVQEEIEKALSKVMKKEIRINGSGRTDAGVHALGQVASFQGDFSIPVDRISLALNALLPEDISIHDAVAVGEDFHARYSAKGKRYIYQIYNHPYRSALYRNYAYFVPQVLDIEAMERAAAYFLGEHDFRGFMASGSSVKDTVRTIYSLDVYQMDKMIKLEISGNGFLYNMVRIIAGTLTEVGKGKIDAEQVPHIIHSCSRKQAGPTAPPQGLYLAEVYY
ncbi:MAG: tRNA pseudouridine(38-40) synthase TruA [Bacillota bacterium]